MRQILLSAFLSLIFSQTSMAQSITGKVVDAKNGESIPFANILIGSESLVSNEDGYFTISESKNNDDSVLTISYLGYVSRQISLGKLKSQQLVVGLEQGIVELADVNVSNVKPDPNTIMAQVKKNLAVHYKMSDQPSKDKLFFRETTSFTPKQLDFEITKSTGFEKKALKSANAQLIAFTSKFISNPPKEYTDMLCNYYRDKKGTAEKPTSVTKLEVLKAIKLKDETRSASLDEMQEAATKILLQHVDSTKYYRFKSGLFGTRDTISLRKDFNAKKNKKEKKTTLTNSKGKLVSFMTESNFLYNAELDFVNKPELYEYSYEGAIYSSENEFVYILKFKPRKSKAKYSGKLYISETDFAVVKADYDLHDGKTLGGFNMKLVLGVKASENVSKGTLIYKQNANGIGYYLQYASVETGQYIYINRPLKFIELSDEDKDIVAFDLKVEGNGRSKTELLSISRSEITETAFESADEKEFTFTKLKKYDPSIWQEYSTIEPLQEMKQFSADN